MNARPVNQTFSIDGKARLEWYGRGLPVHSVFPNGKGVNFVSDEVNVVLLAKAHETKENISQIAANERIVRVAQYQSCDPLPTFASSNQCALVNVHRIQAQGVHMDKDTGTTVAPVRRDKSGTKIP